MGFKPESGCDARASKSEFLASGASGILERSSSGDLVTSPRPSYGADDCRREIVTESQRHKGLGPHPGLFRIIDWDPEACTLSL